MSWSSFVPAQFPVGFVVNDAFEVVSVLGTGATGVVYLCKHRHLDGYPVAMKTFLPSTPNRPALGRAFKREISAAYQVNHPNVIRCYGFIETDDLMAITMEYAAGGNLAQIMEEEGPLSIVDTVSLLIAVASGLDAIHRAGFVHRDLKPENILLTAEGNVKISDFGVAIEDDQDAGKNGILGTVGYISPEYLYTGRCDERSDIFALGVIAYEMLSAKSPFNGRNLLHSLFMRFENDPTRIERLRPDCPPTLARIVRTALARNPERRYQSAAQMLEALKEVDEFIRANHHVTRSESLSRGRGISAGAKQREAAPRNGSFRIVPPFFRRPATTLILRENVACPIMRHIAIDFAVVASIFAVWHWAVAVL